MKIQVIANGYSRFDLLSKKWGLSFLINDELLFDTFCGEIVFKKKLLKNKVDIHRIKRIVISHEHWDHIDGLWWFLKKVENIKVYICSGFSDYIKEKIKKFPCELIEVGNPREICDNIFSTGEIQFVYKDKLMFEQSLILKTADKIAVVTGCSHPGLLNILESIKKNHTGKINLLIGGFHLMNQSSEQVEDLIKSINVRNHIETIIPMHCTGPQHNYLFKKHFPKMLQASKSGNIYHLDL